MTHNYEDSWAKSRECFLKQLELNIYQLNTGYPEHIQNVIEIINQTIK